MKTRIREMRQRRGMTLQQLAAAIRPEPTTAQTIGRLETGVRTVSLDWLAKIADALDCHIADLLELPGRPDIPLIGVVGAQGIVTESASATVELSAAAVRPVAVRIGQRTNGFEEGDILICDRYEGPDIENALGRDAVVRTRDDGLLLRRVLRGAKPDTFTLVPLEAGGAVQYDATLEWAAVIRNLFRTYTA